MDKTQLEASIKKSSREFFKFLKKEVKNSTYLSIFVIYKQTIIAISNNNYNNWGNVFYQLKKYEKCNLFDLGKVLTASKENTLFWEDIAHDKDSLDLQEQRKKFNIANGVSFLIKTHSNKDITIVISICSNLATKKDIFYKEIINKKDIVISKFQELTQSIQYNF